MKGSQALRGNPGIRGIVPRRGSVRRRPSSGTDPRRRTPDNRALPGVGHRGYTCTIGCRVLLADAEASSACIRIRFVGKGAGNPLYFRVFWTHLGRDSRGVLCPALDSSGFFFMIAEVSKAGRKSEGIMLEPGFATENSECSSGSAQL